MSSRPPEISKLEDGQIEISTARLILRGARAADVRSLHEAFSDPEVMKYWYVLRDPLLFCFLFHNTAKEAPFHQIKIFPVRLRLNIGARCRTPPWKKHQAGSRK